MRNPFRYFNASPEVIRLAVMMYVRFPLSLRQVEDLFQARGIDICPETMGSCWNRFGPLIPAEIKKERDLCRRKPSSSTALLLWLRGGDLRPEGGDITVFGY